MFSSDQRIKNKVEMDMNFNCREIVYSKFTYAKSDFMNLDMIVEVQNWKEELESNSVARPVLVGSPFDDDDGNMDLNIELEEELDPELYYVVLYYFYEDAYYAVSDAVAEGWSVNCDSVLAELDVACAMESATDGEETEYFECLSSSERSETSVIIFKDGEVVLQGEIDELLGF